MKRLLIDIDGVLTAYDFKFLVKKYFGIDLSTSSIFAYDLADVLGVSPMQIDMMFKDQVWGKPKFIEGALETLNEWESKSYEIIIYSNRVKYMGEMGLADWLVKNKIPFRGIDANGLGSYDYHIDDSPAKLMYTISIHKLLFSQPWNASCLDITKSLKRVNSWQDIREKVGGINENVQDVCY